MKKLSILLSALFIALSSVFAVDVAKIGETNYETLQAAIDAAPVDGTETTITLLADVEDGAGVFLADTVKGKHYNLIIDFAGHTYNVTTLVGSTGTENQAFHLEKGQKVHLKNGTITSPSAKMIIQNYCELTLTNMNITGSENAKYVVSNNNGECNILGSTSITATEGNNAFDVCVAASYPNGVKVVVNTTGTITGKIEYGVWGNVTTSYSYLTVEEGNFENCEIVVAKDFTDNVAEKIEISGGTFDCVVPADFVAENVTLENPTITANPAELAFEAKSYIKGQTVELKDTLYSELTISNLTAQLAVTVKGENSIFKAELIDNKLRVSYVATTAGEFSDQVEIVSGETKATVTISVKVTELIPAISVNPTEWKPEAITLTNGTATAESEEFVITVENQIDPATVAIQGQNSNFSWNAQTNKVEFLADAEETYKDTLLITTTGAEPVKVPLEITVKAEQVPVQSKNFVKVTENPTDWSGEYLLVYEESETVGYVFSGGDSNYNNEEVTIEDRKIAAEGNENYVITIAPMEGGYSLKFEDKYMAGSSGSNALSFKETAALNTLSLDGDNNVDIVSNTSHMRFNSTANTMRFRYFKSATYTGQKVVALYKLSEPEVITPTTTLSVQETAEVEVGKTVTLNVTRDGNDKLTWGSKDEAIATVDAKGVVTGVAEGEVKIFAVANEISDTCVVTVKKATVKPVITVDPTSLAWGTLTIEEATEGVKKEAVVSVTENATLSVEVTGDDKAAFTAAINGDKLEVTFKATEARAYAAKAVLKATDGAKDVEVALTATVKAAPAPLSKEAFTLVTDASVLTEGVELLIVSTENNVAAGGEFGKGFYNTANITIEDNAITLDANSKAAIFTLGGEDGAWTLTNAEGKVLGINGANLALTDDGTATWTITIDDDSNATIGNPDDASVRILYNVSSPRFKTYTSKISTSMFLPQIYVRGGQEPTPSTKLEIQETAEVEVGKTVTLSVTRDGNDKLTWKSMDETVATVANGVITGVKEGEVKIAVSVGNLSDTCVVTVIEASGETITNCAEAAEAALTVSENNEEYNNGAVYTIPGYVTEIAYAWKSGSMSFWIADTEDGGKVIEAYKCAIEKEEDAVRVGDRVKVTGKLTKYNKTPEFAAGCTVEIIERGEYVEPKNLGEKTIAEFLELKNTTDTCILTGIVANIVMDKDDETQYNKYGNFDLIEGTSKLYVYGLLTADGQAQKFIEMGIDAGDTLTIKAVYSEHNGAPQAKNAIFVSVKKAQGGTTPVEPGEELDVDFGQALYWEDEQGAAWQIMAYDYENEYPMIYFIIDANDKTHLNGTYDIYEGGLWTTANDSVVFVGGTATITCTAAETEQAYATYKVDVTMVDEDGTEYSYSFQVEVVAVDYDNSTEDNPVYITLEDIPSDEPGDQAIDNTVVIDANAPVYNIQGMQVNRNTRGILIQNGQKFILLQ